MHLSTKGLHTQHLHLLWPSLARSAPETSLPLGTPAGKFLQLSALCDPLREGGRARKNSALEPTHLGGNGTHTHKGVAGVFSAVFLGFLSLFAVGESHPLESAVEM